MKTRAIEYIDEVLNEGLFGKKKFKAGDRVSVKATAEKLPGLKEIFHKIKDKIGVVVKFIDAANKVQVRFDNDIADIDANELIMNS